MHRSRRSIIELTASFLAGMGSVFLIRAVHAKCCIKHCPLCTLFGSNIQAQAPVSGGCSGSSDPTQRCANCTCWKSRVGSEPAAASSQPEISVQKSGRVALNLGAINPEQELRQVGDDSPIGDDITYITSQPFS